MIDIGTSLRHYKRKDIQEEMVWSAKDREVAVKYGEHGFGKRPDTLSYPNDVLEFAKNRATSFHVSEEHWINVFNISPELKKEELENLRSGWDLVIDIDCPNWKISKIISWLVVRSLQEHNIHSISAKFSGNKGFHIGVPMKAFPKRIHEKKIRTWFPDGPKRIATYLIGYISEQLIKTTGDKVIFGETYSFTIEGIKEMTNLSDEEITKTRCAKCGKPNKNTEEFVCVKCGIKTNVNTQSCNSCGGLLQKKQTICSCGSDKFVREFNPSSIIDVDTLLISSRHLYRMPYSLHEKSGLVSIPINPYELLHFKKEQAKPQNVIISKNRFLDDEKTNPGEATELVLAAFDSEPFLTEEPKTHVEFETVQDAIPPQLFPPCIHNILSGLKDGKKRSMFILINFLSNVGYNYDKIDEILGKWNKKNQEPLREVIIKGQLRYRTVQKKKVLPPNCNNKSYYKNFGVCTPDAFCARIRNPVNYTVLKAKLAQKKGGRKKLTEEQKEMRRKYREQKKKLENTKKEKNI